MVTTRLRRLVVGGERDCHNPHGWPSSLASCQKEAQHLARLQCNRLWPYVRCGRCQAGLEKCRANCAETVPWDGNWCSFSITGILQSLAI